MFRSRKSLQSSLSSGNASIIKRSSITAEPQLDSEKDCDTPQTQEELTIDTMSAVIAAAVQMSTSKGARSSLSMGNASILQPFSKQEEKKKSRFSLFNNWIKSPTSPTTPGLEPSYEEDDSCSEGSRTSSVSKFDDGRDELSYRGIQIKELKSTLKPFIITDEARFPMPDIKLERPTFAKISY